MNQQTKKLGEVCDISIGKTPARGNKRFWDEKKETNNVWLSIRDLNNTNKKEVFDSREYISDSGAKLCKKVKQGILLASFKLTLGRLAFAGIDLYTNEAIAALEIKNSKELNKEYLYHYLTFFDWDAETKGDVKVKGKTLNKAKLKEIQVLLPPLPEQRRIVKILDEVFKKTGKAKENAERNLKNAKDLFESYLQNVFVNTGKDWEEKKLDEICEMINRGVSPKYTESNGLCVLNQKCIRDHKVNFDLARLHDVKNKKVSSEKYIKIGDVLINSTGTGTLGRVAQVRELNIEATVDSHVTIVRSIKNLFYNKFFGYGLIFIEKEITKRGDGCGGQTELARNTLKNDFRICYPKSLSEQKSIVAKLDALSAETKKLESIYKQKLSDLEELKESVLKKAFEGKL